MKLQMSDARANDGSRLKMVQARLIDEARRFVVMFLYLWIFLGVFVLERGIVLRSVGVSVTWQGFALINALVLAKVMLVAEDLDLSRWLPRRPLIWPILHDAFLLSLLFIGFHFVEEKVVALVRGKSAAESHALGGGGVGGLLSVAAILFISLIPFFAFRHLSRELGEGKINAILFGKAADQE
jgi:hypothetical protein